MRQTIKLTPGSTKWIFLFNGIANTAIGLNQYVGDAKGWGFTVGVLLIAGPLLIVYAAFLFSSSRLMPTVHLNDTSIEVKEDIHKESKSIPWKDIKEITFKSFEINFEMKGQKDVIVVLNTNAQISQEIKRSIRTLAEEKRITVNGG